MLKWLARFLGPLALLLCAASSWAWWDSYTHTLTFKYSYYPHQELWNEQRSFNGSIENGRVQVDWTQSPAREEPKLKFARVSNAATANYFGGGNLFGGVNTPERVLLFFRFHLKMGYVAAFSGLISLWFIAPLLSRYRKYRRLLKQGYCDCGYDLRFSPLRCPECGTPVKKIESPSQVPRFWRREILPGLFILFIVAGVLSQGLISMHQSYVSSDLQWKLMSAVVSKDAAKAAEHIKQGAKPFSLNEALALNREIAIDLQMMGLLIQYPYDGKRIDGTLLLDEYESCSSISDPSEWCLVLRNLLEHGVNSEKTDENGRTLLQLATESRYKKVPLIRLLLEDRKRRGKLSRDDLNNLFSQMHFYERDDVLAEYAGLLLELGADINSKRSDGTTPLKFARDEYMTRLEALLLSKGAK